MPDPQSIPAMSQARPTLLMAPQEVSSLQPATFYQQSPYPSNSKVISPTIIPTSMRPNSASVVKVLHPNPYLKLHANTQTAPIALSLTMTSNVGDRTCSQKRKIGEPKERWDTNITDKVARRCTAPTPYTPGLIPVQSSLRPHCLTKEHL